MVNRRQRVHKVRHQVTRTDRTRPVANLGQGYSSGPPRGECLPDWNTDEAHARGVSVNRSLGIIATDDISLLPSARSGAHRQHRRAGVRPHSWSCGSRTLCSVKIRLPSISILMNATHETTQFIFAGSELIAVLATVHDALDATYHCPTVRELDKHSGTTSDRPFISSIHGSVEKSEDEGPWAVQRRGP